MLARISAGATKALSIRGFTACLLAPPDFLSHALQIQAAVIV
ncbi:MAG: hypothetical protein ACLPTZ_20610 [Beijerinckiaceae bacterium]